MVASMIQKTKDRRQRAEICVPLRGTFIKGATAPQKHLYPLFSVFCFLFSAFCHAEALPDPTRPPAETSAPQAQAAPKEGGLQSVFISPARRAAIINGETIELGGRLGDSTLVEINESSVVLKGPEGLRAVPLFPGVALTGKSTAPPVQKSTKRTGKNKRPRPGKIKPAAPEEIK